MVEDLSISFKTEHLRTNLKERSIRGASVTVVGQSLKFILNTASTMILARFLTPQEFGIMAMVWAIVAFAFIFKDLGLSMATVQMESISHAQVSNLFWINVGFGGGVTLLFIILSPIVAWFYGEDKLKLITIALAFSYTFSGLTAQHQALLKRQMRFTALSMTEVTSITVGVTTAIILAWWGAGYWALVVKELTTSFSRTLLIWSLCKWWPGLPDKKESITKMLRFGANLSIFNILNYFARNFDNVLIGKFLGAKSLGLYSKAYSLLLLPLNQINVPIANVAVPTLSRLQNDEERFRRYYCKAINIACFLSMPLVLAIAVLSNEIIIILLGEQWKDAGSIFKILAIAAFGQTLSQTTGWILVSLGQTDRMVKWTVFTVPIIIFSFIIGLPWGVHGVAISYTICNYLLLVPLFMYVLRKSPITISNIIKAIWRPLIISLLMAIFMSIVHYYFRAMTIIVTISATAFSGIIVVGISILILPGAKSDIQNFREIIQLLKGSQIKR